MARGLIAGCTDYDSQPVSEIFHDMEQDIIYINNQQVLIQKYLSISKDNSYWDSNVPDDFKLCYFKLKNFLIP